MYTDNNPLTYVLTSAKLNATGHRWVGELADFHFDIKYRPGSQNGDADALSRMPMGVKFYPTRCFLKVMFSFSTTCCEKHNHFLSHIVSWPNCRSHGLLVVGHVHQDICWSTCKLLIIKFTKLIMATRQTIQTNHERRAGSAAGRMFFGDLLPWYLTVTA